LATPVKPLFFATPAHWRRWLAANYHRADEVVVGFYKKASGVPSITWPESVDEALCFGWIDGVRNRIDGTSYQIRFTPRRKGSIWSSVNVGRVAELTKNGRMRPAGVRAFEARTKAKTAIYSFEQQKKAKLPAAFERRFKANAAAWAFYNTMPPWYQRTTTWWVTSAKREETRLKRLATLIDNCANHRTIAELRRGKQ
jgi:uncharacterized protein YdeI (YjbR/CyaY-like superfamily)